MEKYLASGLIRGIGPIYANKLVRAFGEAVFDIIELPSWRQGHADQERLQQGGLEWRPRGRVGIDAEERELAFDFDGREVIYGFGKLDELVLSYATTIHKKPGLGHPVVAIPLSTQQYVVLQENLVYARQAPARLCWYAAKGARSGQWSTDEAAMVEVCREEIRLASRDITAMLRSSR